MRKEPFYDVREFYLSGSEGDGYFPGVLYQYFLPEGDGMRASTGDTLRDTWRGESVLLQHPHCDEGQGSYVQWQSDILQLHGYPVAVY
jgi:hypothetical protein